MDKLQEIKDNIKKSDISYFINYIKKYILSIQTVQASRTIAQAQNQRTGKVIYIHELYWIQRISPKVAMHILTPLHFRTAHRIVMTVHQKLLTKETPTIEERTVPENKLLHNLKDQDHVSISKLRYVACNAVAKVRFR